MSASCHPIDYSEQKQQLLERMLTLSKAQLNCLEENREDELSAVLDESEEVRAKIDALDFKLTADGSGRILSPGMREMLEEIRRLDEQCKAYVEERLLFYKAELKNIRQSGKQMQQYVNPYTVADSVFIDMRK